MKVLSMARDTSKALSFGGKTVRLGGGDIAPGRRFLKFTSIEEERGGV